MQRGRESASIDNTMNKTAVSRRCQQAIGAKDLTLTSESTRKSAGTRPKARFIKKEKYTLMHVTYNECTNVVNVCEGGEHRRSAAAAAGES